MSVRVRPSVIIHCWAVRAVNALQTASKPTRGPTVTETPDSAGNRNLLTGPARLYIRFLFTVYNRIRYVETYIALLQNFYETESKKNLEMKIKS